MKKILFLALGLSVCLNLYLIDSNVEVVNDFDEKPIKRRESVQDKVKLAQSSVSKTIKPKESSCSCENIVGKKVADEVSSDPQEKYDQEVVSKKISELKKKWLKESNDYFYNDLRLRDDQIRRYHELVEMRKFEADEYFNPKLKKIAEEKKEGEGGELPYYIHTTEDTVFMGRLAERYDSLLKENFGDQAFSDYKKYIHKYNKEIAKEEFFYPIEF